MPQILVLKLASIKDLEQESAQDGMKSVISEERVKPEAEAVDDEVVAVVFVVEYDEYEVVVKAGVASTTGGTVVTEARVAHSSSSLSRLLTAILGNNIYLPDDNDDDNNNYRQHI